MEQVWVICEGGQKCHKLPCMALVDSSINIKKFKECFWSHVPCNWRLAEGAETMFPKCATCAAYGKAESAPKAPNSTKAKIVTSPHCIINYCAMNEPECVADKQHCPYDQRGKS